MSASCTSRSGKRAHAASRRRRDKASPRRFVLGGDQAAISRRQPHRESSSKHGLRYSSDRWSHVPSIISRCYWCPGAESNHRHGDFQSARWSGQVLVRQEENALSQHRRIANASKERTSDGWAVARNMGVHLAHRGALSRADASRWWRWHRVRTDSPGNPGDESAQDSRVDVSGS